MKIFRIIGNIMVGLVLAAILFGLIAVIIDEQLSKAESIAHVNPFTQEVPFER